MDRNKKNKRYLQRFLCLLSIFVLTAAGCKKKAPQEGETDNIAETPAITEEPTTEPTQEAADNEIEAKVDTPFMTKEEFPRIDGSTANIPLGEAVYSYITGATEEEAKNDLKFYKTPDSYRRLISGDVDLLMVYEPSQIILDEIKESGVELEFKPLGKDALVFIANEGNPVQSLTKQQIIDIYTGKTTNWSEVGGKSQEILPFQRPATSGSQTLMEKLAVGADIIMNSPTVSRPTDMGDLIDVLAMYNNDSNALGYSVYFYAKNMYTKPGLRFMAIDDVMPTNETIQKGSYPYVNDFYAVVRKDEPQGTKARQLFDWLTTTEAQQILADVGYVPVIDLAVAKAEGAGSVAVYKNGPLNIPEDSYVVIHDTNEDGTYTGDILVDRNLNPVISFQGKQVVTQTDLVCKADQIIRLETEKLDPDSGDRDPESEDKFHDVQYELFDLKTQTYITDHPYDYILPYDSGIFVCCAYDSLKSQTSIFNSDGKLIYDITEDDSTERIDYSALKDRLLIYHAQQVHVYDYEGNELDVKEFPTGYFADYNAEPFGTYNYTGFKINSGEDYKIVDHNGDIMSGEIFLKNSEFAGSSIDLTIQNLLIGEDDSIVIAGYIHENMIVADQEGNILYQNKCDRDSKYISLHKNFFEVYNYNSEGQTCYNMEGEPLNKTSKDIMGYINGGIVFANPDGFRVYNYYGDIQYDVKTDDYDKEAFWGTEAETIPEAIMYYTKDVKKDELIPHGSFKGIWNIDGALYGRMYDTEHYILENYNYNEDDASSTYMLVDNTGDILYQGSKNETIQGLIVGDETYMYIEHGNYAGIKNLKGEYLYRQYSPKLVDD